MQALKELDCENARIMVSWGDSGEPKTNRNDSGMVAVHVIGHNRYQNRLDYYLLIDYLWGNDETLYRHYKRLSDMLEFFQVKPEVKQDIVKSDIHNEYNPETEYVVSRLKSGRPRRVLNDEEQEKVMSMRAEGMSINEISKRLRVSNRLVMAMVRAGSVGNDGKKN